MYKTTVLLISLITILLSSCQEPEPPSSSSPAQPYVNQINTKFNSDEIQCLLNQYQARTYHEEGPVVFRVIRDTEAYRSFFACKSGTTLQQINFTNSSLLVGMNSGSAHPTPISIRKMAQSLIKDKNGDYTLRVTVTGKKTMPEVIGGEWFAFTFLVPKMDSDSNVTLEMRYEYD